MIKSVIFFCIEVYSRAVWSVSRPEQVSGRVALGMRLAVPILSPLLHITGMHRQRVRGPSLGFNHAMGHLRRQGRIVPLDIAMCDADALLAVLDEGRGVFVSAVHTSLTMAAHSAFSDRGHVPVFVGYFIGRGHGMNWGSTLPLETIEASEPMVLRKISEAVGKGRLVITFVDYTIVHEHKGADLVNNVCISPNSLDWMEKQKKPMFHMHTELTAKGVIAMHFFELGGEAEKADTVLDLARSHMTDVSYRIEKRKRLKAG